VTGNSRKIFVPSVGSREEVTRNVRCVKATIEGSLAGEPRFNILDAGLERRHLLLQLGQVARENLAPPALVAKARLDPAQPLGDRLILLLEALEPAVDLVEVAEHLASQFGNLAVDLVESAVHLIEAASNVIELVVNLLKALVDLLEALVDFIEAAVDLGEPPPEELDQLFVFSRGHGPMTIPNGGEDASEAQTGSGRYSPALAMQ